MNFDQMKQAMELKAKMDKIQKEMEKTMVEGEAGKGAVTVTMNGQMKVKSVKVSTRCSIPRTRRSWKRIS